MIQALFLIVIAMTIMWFRHPKMGRREPAFQGMLEPWFERSSWQNVKREIVRAFDYDRARIAIQFLVSGIIIICISGKLIFGHEGLPLIFEMSTGFIIAWCFYAATRVAEICDEQMPGPSEKIIFAAHSRLVYGVCWTTFGLPAIGLRQWFADTGLRLGRLVSDISWRISSIWVQPRFTPEGQGVLRGFEVEPELDVTTNPSCEAARTDKVVTPKVGKSRAKVAQSKTNGDLFNREWDGKFETLGAVARHNFPNLPEIIARLKIMNEYEACHGGLDRSTLKPWKMRPKK
jgi:hypothetical protein